jgi:DNA-binding MarR family transcriptional regulator
VRERSQQDRRQVLVRVTPLGKRLLSRLVQPCIAELRSTGSALVSALSAVVARTSHRTLHGK